MTDLEFRERVVFALETLLLLALNGSNRDEAIQTVLNLRRDHEADKRTIERSQG